MSDKVSNGFQWLENDQTGNPSGLRRPRDGAVFPLDVVAVQSLVSGGWLTVDGKVVALSEVAPVVTMTGTAAAFTGACEYAGLNIRAVTGTVNITVYDAASATGSPIQTELAVTLGGKPWMGAGTNHRRANGVGVWVVVSGGGTVVFDVLAD